MFPYTPFPEDEDEPPWDITVDPSVVDEIRKCREKEREEKKERAEVERVSFIYALISVLL